MSFLLTLSLVDPSINHYLEQLRSKPSFTDVLEPNKRNNAFTFSKTIKPGDFGYILNNGYSRTMMWDLRWGWKPEMFVQSPYYKKEGLSVCKAELATQYEEYLADRDRRCVIMATDYRQWATITDRDSGQVRKVCYKITHKKYPLMFIAGIWGPDADARAGFGFAAFTVPSQQRADKIAERTPLILSPDEAIQYMTGSSQEVQDILSTSIVDADELNLEIVIS